MTTATTPTTRTPNLTAPQTPAWRQRALALAAAKHPAWRSVRHDEWGEDACGLPERVIVRVDSQTRAGVTYDVVFDFATHDAICPCAAGQHDAPCCHAGVAIEYAMQVWALSTPVRQAERERAARLDTAHEHCVFMLFGRW